jgi:hypothetical protein
VRKLDSISRPEFAGIFDRVSLVVELAGATTALRIENRLKIEIHRAKSISKDIKEVRLRALRKFYWSKAEKLDKLKEHDFAGRAIHEANRDPKGSIALTLLHGREEAMKRIKAQKKAAIRARAYVIPEKYVAEKVSKGLSLRERLRRRWR